MGERRRKRREAAHKLALAALLPLLLGVSCARRELVWTETRSFPSDRWEGRHKITFAPDSAFLEARERVKGVLVVRYGRDASAERLRLVMETESPGPGRYASDTLTLRLLPSAARTAGEGRLGVFETADSVALSIQPDPGWSVTFHPLDEEDVEGLLSLTFELVR